MSSSVIGGYDKTTHNGFPESGWSINFYDGSFLIEILIVSTFQCLITGDKTAITLDDFR